MMSSPFTSWPVFTIATGISILLTLVAAEVAILLLRRLTKEKNTATLMATHSAEAAAIADIVITMRDGKIVGVQAK